ncbi:alpha/beta hydrolase-fold protein [Actinokineospora auranticolor]|uniref:S-formylglutathione hydrolase FrmB n=1 Tax=Actinokineospora auranticolor TaxID=155976 RepID=A0A2S6GUW3_9PSEU|nr:alpha/beta hydrolase-fold protein [Actinokineospora auranticolor]PPK69035.1 S-formylglutathione hydrolase FrmB [Actinokineospora auranticolor]
MAGFGGVRVSRRSLLVAGAAGVATAGVVVGAATRTLPLLDVIGAAVGGGGEPVIRTERVWSAARGTDVDLVTVLPEEPVSRNLPVCLLLHGLRGNAKHAAPTGLARALARRVSDGDLPPFAFVAVDGGDNYWHENHVGDNSMAMLLDDVPRWLRARGLGDSTGTPFACAGVSMGGFGALLYARRRQELRRPLSAVAAVSPGLLMSWREMSTRRAFKSNQEWASLDPLRNVEKLGKTPVGIWCGTEDHFIEGARKFIRLAAPEVAYTGPGGHGDSFYRGVVPSVLDFLGKHAPVAPGV